jgi:hypothetical protein
MKTEEALPKAQLQALLFESLKHKTQVLKVFVKRATLDNNAVEVDNYELV